ncbi:Glycosyltransferase involved in cell wall bisynthesis [Candidatus Kryptonium thompsonii]|jgi:glycosyltransferase involved in cell wall biosynthesis|uniref:Glycosyltransferase involved in cell wall bisynthesis n=1 Tax=Candidatus Kryptonium thompsonii TaxID=1633631 RepID=A0A0P1LQ89_9BACT|nr:GT4 family glycosyltransferase PelF [Candidatus Kryptonium thompsoni]CUS79128.1 Glycosyltransferase involved in cell wall bisynthesis [Candidatus Kryptonium thompsoni]CUS83788.1 Glycosyltransferase involved in cell wall bisynthesis [Candidatus Kryptonium thompsoni]CUS88408.1 Glycosyltransferase involved in cell wall bisynthesis [Candidatus Kryptonium thompsoni]CUT00072.1 Glycosyltransferase involved in cell wall bisynthesis [Candidatus Kryptonium thompsoni]CUT02831.1 Glycosyltransferase inv
MVDVCLILEGTYPYVVGGVSKWTHALVKNLSEIEFSIVHLHSGEERKIKFEVPENVKSIVEIDVRNGFGFRFDFRDLIDVVPEAKVYHSLSTGFAGLLGLQVKSVKNKPLVLTEHGLYWKEIEFGVDEVECGFKIFKNLREKEKVCVERRRYLEIFKEIAKKCYLGADVVTTVCRYNLEQQLSLISNGKNSTDLNLKFRVIENFVEPEFFGTVVRKVRSEKVISFIGRVVPIKDVKTFIRAMPLILDGIGDVKFLIVGDLMQDPEYVDECFELVRELGLVGKVKFTGEANAVDYLKISDVLVLPSVSEGQPFVVLEAMASGVPVVATCVGGVPELIDESGFECGLLFDVGDYVKLAENVLKILSDESLSERLAENGIKKARRFTVERFINGYAEIYRRFI